MEAQAEEAAAGVETLAAGVETLALALPPAVSALFKESPKHQQAMADMQRFADALNSLCELESKQRAASGSFYRNERHAIRERINSIQAVRSRYKLKWTEALHAGALGIARQTYYRYRKLATNPRLWAIIDDYGYPRDGVIVDSNFIDEYE